MHHHYSRIADGAREDFSTDSDTLGDAYEYLLDKFAAGIGQEGGRILHAATHQRRSFRRLLPSTSQEPATGKRDPRQNLGAVYDFACGSGSLLAERPPASSWSTGMAVGMIYGQEKNITTYNLARMNMLLHGVKDAAFKIHHGDTLVNDWDVLTDPNPANRPKFDAVVANPPFSYRWTPRDETGDDARFKDHGVAPKSAADFAFLLHGLHYLKDDGTMAIILPHGVLFRGGAEARIRQKLLEDGHIDTVIGLPANLFYSTGIPVCILVLKKCKRADDVLFINAEKEFDKGKRQNFLKAEHIERIVGTYKERPAGVERYARRVPMAEIEGNEYNLNISRYVTTAEAEAEVDLAAVHDELVAADRDAREASARHNAFLAELGLPGLP